MIKTVYYHKNKANIKIYTQKLYYCLCWSRGVYFIDLTSMTTQPFAMLRQRKCVFSLTKGGLHLRSFLSEVLAASASCPLPGQKGSNSCFLFGILNSLKLNWRRRFCRDLVIQSVRTPFVVMSSCWQRLYGNGMLTATAAFPQSCSMAVSSVG